MLFAKTDTNTVIVSVIGFLIVFCVVRVLWAIFFGPNEKMCPACMSDVPEDATICKRCQTTLV